MKLRQIKLPVVLSISVLIAATLFVSPSYGMDSPSSLSELVTLKRMEKESANYEAIARNDRPSLIEFYADWCASCQHFAPKLKAIRDRFPTEINWVMVDIDDVKWSDLMQQYGVVGVPYLALLDPDRKVRESWTGEVPPAVLESAIAQVLN